MGCQGGKNVPPVKKNNNKDESKKLLAAERAERRKHLNPADFVISKKTGEAIVKTEGIINGEQFNVEECTDCDIFLLDHMATSFIDHCKNCRIFIGPVESSVMVRNCVDCDFVIACQQFRCRDCQNCRFAMLCTTEPVIETSTNMRFACFEFGYFSLRQQLEKAELRPVNNKWWQVYDFNKNADKPNWSLFPQEEAGQLLRLDACQGAVSQDELTMDSAVPVTLGSRPWPFQESCVVVFLPDSEAFVEAFLSQVAKKKADGWVLCRTRSTSLPEDRLKSLFAWTKEPKLAARCKGSEVTGIEVCGTDIVKQVQEVFANTGLAVASKNVRILPDDIKQAMGKPFSEVWKEEI